MRGKERILAAMAGGQADCTPVAIDYLHLYLAERIERLYVEAYRDRLERQGRLRIDPDEDVHIRAKAMIHAYDCFQERHDWFAAFAGPGREALRQRELVLENGRVFEIDHAAGTRRQMLLSGQEAKTEEFRDRFEKMRQAGQEREHLDKILAEYRARALRDRGDFRLVKILAQEVGEQYFVYTGAGAPFWSLYGLIGFEAMMTALHDAPDLVFRMMDRLMEFTLEDAQAFKDAGGHGIRVEECLASADMISQKMYERFAWPYEEKLFSQLRRMGLKVMLYFCGDVMPRLPALRQLPIDALMVEESKKDFTIDIGDVRKAVGPNLCLWGNIDVYHVLQRGTEQDIKAEVIRQIQAAGQHGAFVVGVGSPLPLDLPPQRADLLIRYARQYSCSVNG